VSASVGPYNSATQQCNENCVSELGDEVEMKKTLRGDANTVRWL